MSKQTEHDSGAGNVQIFELTMDNPEDQDELNRRLRKPGEPDCSRSSKTGRALRSETTGKPPAKKKGHRKGKS